MDTYTPKPLDTSRVELPEEILGIAEILAENTHEVWAKGRMAEGWTYGEKKDDDLKTHPSLVPYEELSEEEKDYDRRTSQETLKVLYSMGYRLIRETTDV